MFNSKDKSIVKRLVCMQMVIMFVMSGCSNKYGKFMEPSKNRDEISQAHSELSSMANKSDLPMIYVSEGKVGISNVEAALEAADTFDVQARAELDKKLADSNARLTEVEAYVSQKLSEAEALRKTYLKEYSKAMSQISAREAELEALIERKEANITSLARENESKCNDIISDGLEKFESETARIDQLREIYSAIEAESNAKIVEMTESSKATRERAAATVSELEAEALAIQQKTRARIDELQEQIESTGIRTESEAKRLKVASETILVDSAAEVKELRKKASTIEANLANESYELKLTEAASAKAEGEAKTQEKSANAPTRFDKAMAEIDRLRAEVKHHQQNSASTYDSNLATIEAKLADELNEVKKIYANSARSEQVARSEFVKAEAAARAEAVRQTVAHADVVAEAQKLAIIAEAEAEAARIKQEVLDEMAAKKAADKVEIANNTTEMSQQSEELHQVPEVPQVVAVAPRIEPDHIANFRISLAEVMRVHSKAEIHELVAQATFSEAKTNLDAIKSQEDAVATEKLAIADALEGQARSRFKEIEIKMEKEMEVLDSKYQQSVVQAESFRKEKEAEVLDIYSQALALEQISKARAEQLLAESESVMVCGKNEVEELETTLWAVDQRGQAQYSKLMTEAKSVTDSQEALALQIDAQIDSARRYLDAELSKIRNSIDSSEKIAQADYQESIVRANVQRKKTAAAISKINAQFTMEHAISKAQIDRDKKLAMSQNLRGEAACDRMVAVANTTKLCKDANIDADKMTAMADMNIVLTNNSAKRDSAQAYLTAIKSRFNARVQQVEAERVVDMAKEHNDMVVKRTDLASALAKATAAREDSNRKFSELKKRQSELQTASIVNWSSKLAMYKSGNTEVKAVLLGN